MDAHDALLAGRNALLRAGTLEVYGALTREGIGVRVLKGMALEFLLLGPHGTRQYIDVDLLIRPRDWHRSQQVLRRLGFVRADQGDVTRRQVHGTIFRRQAEHGPMVEVDLHHRLHGARVASRRVWSCVSDDPLWIPAGPSAGVHTTNLPSTLYLLAISALPEFSGTDRHLQEYRTLRDAHPGLVDAGREVARELGALAAFDRALSLAAGRLLPPPEPRIPSLRADAFVAHLRRAPTLRARAGVVIDALRDVVRISRRGFVEVLANLRRVGPGAPR